MRPQRLAVAAVLLLTGSGVSHAQQQAAPPLITPPPPAAARPAPAAEEAPPAVVPAPTPLVVPPIAPEEVEAAPAAPTPKPPPQTRRARYDVAVIQAIDKVTAETARFEAPVGRPTRYKNLIFTVRACERSMPDESVEDSIAYMTVDAQSRHIAGRATPPARQAFKGWMYASSPGLNPMEHPTYDAWLITCRAATPAKAAPAR